MRPEMTSEEIERSIEEMYSDEMQQLNKQRMMLHYLAGVWLVSETNIDNLISLAAVNRKLGQCIKTLAKNGKSN